MRSTSRVATPPTVSMDRDRGVTSSSRMPLLTESALEPDRVSPWMAAPWATHSSGLMLLLGSLPVSWRTFCCTAGMRVEPPTSSTRPSSEAAMPASFRAACTGPEVRSTKSRVISLNLLRVRVKSKCTGAPPCWVI